MGGDVEGDVLDGRCDPFAADGRGVFGEDGEFGEGDDGVIRLFCSEVLSAFGVFGDVSEEVREVVEVGRFIVGAIGAFDEEVHKLVNRQII